MTLLIECTFNCTSICITILSKINTIQTICPNIPNCLTDRLPDVLKAESYAFVALPAEAFWDGQVNTENIKRGRLCPIRDLPKTGWIHGITLFSKVRIHTQTQSRLLTNMW